MRRAPRAAPSRPLAALAIGALFGLTLTWTWLSDPAVIRESLRLRDPFIFLVLGSALAVATAGLRVVGATGGPSARPERRHVVGGALFGVGWALAGACPGPVVTQLGQGVGWSAFTLAGMIGGILLHRRLGHGRGPGADPRRAPPCFANCGGTHGRATTTRWNRS